MLNVLRVAGDASGTMRQGPYPAGAGWHWFGNTLPARTVEAQLARRRRAIDRVTEGTMSSLKRWRQVGQGQFHKWETPGEELEGTWRGAQALLDRVQRVRVGAEVLIRYTGPQTSRGGPVVQGFRGVRHGGRGVGRSRASARGVPLR
jgi:hypothetical protein